MNEVRGVFIVKYFNLVSFFKVVRYLFSFWDFLEILIFMESVIVKIKIVIIVFLYIYIVKYISRIFWRFNEIKYGVR